VGPKSNFGCPYERKKIWHRDTEEDHDEDEGEDYNFTATSQGTPKIFRSHQKLKEGYGTGSTSECPERTSLANTWISDF
jgi:hypothetical protein